MFLFGWTIIVAHKKPTEGLAALQLQFQPGYALTQYTLHSKSSTLSDLISDSNQHTHNLLFANVTALKAVAPEQS